MIMWEVTAKWFNLTQIYYYNCNNNNNIVFLCLCVNPISLWMERYLIVICYNIRPRYFLIRQVTKAEHICRIYQRVCEQSSPADHHSDHV